MRSSWPLLIVPVLVDSCPSCTRTWSCPWAPAGSKLAFGKAAWSHWSWLCEQLFCPDTWGFVVLLWSDPRCLGVGALNNLSSPCYLLWLREHQLSCAGQPCLWACAVKFYFCSPNANNVMNKIQRWCDPSEAAYGKVMNEDEDSFF